MISTDVEDYDMRKNRQIDRYHGKTARLKSGLSRSMTRWQLHTGDVHVEHPKIISNDGVMTLTKVDYLFGTFDNQAKFLGKTKLWETVVNELESSATEKSTVYNSRSRVMTTSYEIPVVSHTVVKCASDIDGEKRRSNNFGPKWLMWKGASYDPSKLYVVNNSGPGTADRLKAVCSTTEAPTVFTDDLLIKPILFKACKANNDRANITSCCAISAYTCNVYNTCWAGDTVTNWVPVPITPENCLANGIIIDLKSVHLLTHLAVRGTMPSCITFPHQFYSKQQLGSKSGFGKEDQKPGKDMFGSKFLRRQGVGYRRRRRRKNIGSVQVLRRPPTELPHVTSFDLYRKELGSGQWIKVVSSLHIPIANYGITSALVDLKSAGAFNCSSGLRSRFIKLVPTSWHISPVFRVMVYGKKLLTCSSAYDSMLSDTSLGPEQDITDVAFGMKGNDLPIGHKSTVRQLRQELRDRTVASRHVNSIDVPMETRTYTLSPAMHSSWMLDGTWHSYRDDYMYRPEQRKRNIKKFIKAALDEIE